MRLKNFVLAICCTASLSACNISGSPFGQASQPSLTGPTTIPPTSGFGDPSTTITLDAAGNVHWIGGDWYVPLPVSAGDVIGSVSAVVQDNAGASGNAIIGQLVMRSPSTGDTPQAQAWTNGDGVQKTLTITPNSPYTVPVGVEMLAKFHAMGNNLQPPTYPSMTGPVTVDPAPAPTNDTIASSNVLSLIGPSVGSTWTSGIGPNGEMFAISTTASTTPVALTLRAGDRIKRLSFKVFGNGSADISATAYRINASMVGLQIGTVTVTDPPASWATATIDVTDTTLSELEAISIDFVATDANIRLGNISYAYDHP